MNKSDLIQKLAEEKDLSPEEASDIVNIFFNSMKEALKEGRRVEIRGFGSFKIKEYEGYVGRNPKTGEKVEVKPKKLPFFKVGKDLKDYLNS
ncbi:MAG: integration host factor subunit beta [Desulfonauticus sp.]|jgi:integration host factor subunit beta|nr:integration host factor subunit beta [Desulfonauticus sp.]